MGCQYDSADKGTYCTRAATQYIRGEGKSGGIWNEWEERQESNGTGEYEHSA